MVPLYPMRYVTTNIRLPGTPRDLAIVSVLHGIAALSLTLWELFRPQPPGAWAADIFPSDVLIPSAWIGFLFGCLGYFLVRRFFLKKSQELQPSAAAAYLLSWGFVIGGFVLSFIVLDFLMY